MTPLSHATRAACLLIAFIGLGSAAYAALPAALLTAAMLWALGGVRRDPLWWCAAALIWARGACIWLVFAAKSGAVIANRSRAACFETSWRQADWQ